MSAIKMDELLVSWLGSDDVYENVLDLIENYRATHEDEKKDEPSAEGDPLKTATTTDNHNNNEDDPTVDSSDPPPTTTTTPTMMPPPIPPFYPVKVAGRIRKRRQMTVSQKDTWDPLPEGSTTTTTSTTSSSSTTTPSSPPPAAGSSASNPIPLLPQLLDSRSSASSSPHVKEDGTAEGEEGAASAEQQQQAQQEPSICVRDQTMAIYAELGQDPPLASPTSDDDDDDYGDSTTTNNSKRFAQKYLTVETFVRVTKDVCGFPSFFNIPLYARILALWNAKTSELAAAPMEVITLEMLEWFWKTEMEPYDPCDRFFRLVAQIGADAILRDDFLPFIKALLQDHPGLEFLSSHAEFQEKYAVTVITRIFYGVNTCHSGRITARQVRRSDLLQAFQQVDEEEDINKVTRYFSYEHFYVLYCRFWELDHDRDYRITREDLLKYGDQSLSHMIVDRIFDAAPRPFEPQQQLLLLQQQQQQGDAQQQQQQQLLALQQQPPRPSHRDYLSYEDFIYFMLSEEDKSNEVSVKYWFTCVDVDGDGKLNNMELRSFYAVQLHRMQFMGHEVVPFEDMLCQMMDMIKPAHNDFLVETDFLQPECRQVSGALFDALFNLNKYLLFEQRDPFVERQKREDEFDCDWDRFACLDYSRLAMEEEAREEEAMEIDWVTVDDEEEDEDDDEEDDDDEDDDDDDDGPRGGGLTYDDDDLQHTDDDSESDLQGAAMLQYGMMQQQQQQHHPHAHHHHHHHGHHGGGGGNVASEAPF